MDQNITATGTEARAAEDARFIQKVYGWMCTGLIVTGVIAYLVPFMPAVTNLLFGNMWIFYGLLLAEILAVLYLSVRVSKMSPGAATSMFLLYAALNGFTFSLIFLIFEISSIGMTFGITAGMFGLMSIYGYHTKTDLTSAGNLAFMGLIGIIFGSITNLFLQNTTVDYLITYLGILIFTALTAYDTQKIKTKNIIGNEGTGEDQKESIMGALELYLDFINLFLKLLNVFGKRK